MSSVDLARAVPLLTRALLGAEASSMGFLCPWLPELPDAVNHQREAQLVAALSAWGLQPVEAWWRDGDPPRRLHLRRGGGRREPVIGVADVTLAQMTELRRRFKATGIYAGPETGGYVMFLTRDGGAVGLLEPRDVAVAEAAGG